MKMDNHTQPVIPRERPAFLVPFLIIVIIALVAGISYFLGTNTNKSQTVNKTAPVSTSPTPTIAESTPAPSTTVPTISTTTESKTGKASGKLCYPSDHVPAGKIMAKNLNTGKVTEQAYPGSQAGVPSTYTLELEPGEYHIKFNVGSEVNPYAGYYTTYSQCADNPNAGEIEICRGSKTRPALTLTIESNTVVSNVNLCDYYYPSDQPPDF